MHTLHRWLGSVRRTVRWGVVALVLVLYGVVLGCAIDEAPIVTPPAHPWRATVQAIRFYESGRRYPPKEQRQYATTFEAGSARFINVELDLTHPAPGRVVDLPLTCTYVGANGTNFAKIDLSFKIQPTSTNSWWANGWGWDSPGHWPTGTYQVICRGEQVSARGAFEVAPPRAAPPAARTPRQVPPFDWRAAYQAQSRGDYAIALQLASGPAQAGDANAQDFMGDLYREGQGVPKDPATAAKWYEAATNGGDKVGCLKVAFRTQFSYPRFGPREPHSTTQYLGQLIGFSAEILSSRGVQKSRHC